MLMNAHLSEKRDLASNAAQPGIALKKPFDTAEECLMLSSFV
jgi:hypothetical protein